MNNQTQNHGSSSMDRGWHLDAIIRHFFDDIEQLSSSQCSILSLTWLLVDL